MKSYVDLDIHVFVVFGELTFGFNYDYFNWIVYINGKPVVVDKRYVVPIETLNFYEFLDKYSDKKDELLKALARMIHIPPELYYIPTESIVELLKTLKGD